MRNNVIKIGALALLSAFALTACSKDVIAKPTGYDENSPVVEIDSKTDIYNNNFTDVYDSIRAGNIPSDVLDTLLYQYAVSVFGNYNKVTANKISNNSFGEITLKQAVDNYRNGDKKIAATFINEHSAYWTKDKQGDRVRAEGQAEGEPSNSEYARLDQKWNTIEKRIAQKMYSLISGGSYSEESVFDEAKFIRSLSSSIENNVINTPVKTFKGVLTAQVEDYDVFTDNTSADNIITNAKDFILHRENYQSNADVNQVEALDQDATYVEDKLIPDIYRQLLVEQYILDKSYDTLGRTSARNISVLALPKNSNYAKGAINLMNAYISNYVFDDTKTIDLKSFKMISEIWTGTFMGEENVVTFAKAYKADNTYDSDIISEELKEKFKLMYNAAPEYLEITKHGEEEVAYFKGTAYGDMMEQIEKISPNPKASENESSYTGSNSYTIEVVQEIKTRELQLQDYTSTGWYIKSVGVSDLPDSIKNQLFDINVANALNPEFDENNQQKNGFCVEYLKDDKGNWTTNVDQLEKEGESTSKYINVVGKVNGNYFLRNTSRIKGNPVESDILFESDSKYYIVLVEDAIRSKNLDKKDISTLSQDQLDTLETYINEIVQIVSNNDTYKNLSKKHWLEEMNLEYYDTVVYEYFKSNFPELFD